MSVPTPQKSELYDLAKLGYDTMQKSLGRENPWPFATIDPHIKSAWVAATLAIKQAIDVSMNPRA